MASIEKEVEYALINVVSGIGGVNFFTSESDLSRTLPSVTVQTQIGSEEIVPFSGVFKTPTTITYVARADTTARADFDAKFYDILEQLYRSPDLASYLTDHSNLTFYVAKVTGDSPSVISQNRTWSRAMTLDITATSKPFSPSNLSSLSLWLKADAGVTLSGSNVTAWADQSGNGNDATARIGNATFVSSVINQRPVLRFDGTANLLTNNFLVNNYNTPLTIIAVSKASGSTVRGNQPTARYVVGATYHGGWEYGLCYGAYGGEFPNFSVGYGISFESGGVEIESSPMGENEIRIASTINNGSEILFFLNGSSIGTADPASQSGGNDSTGAFSIGSDVVFDEHDDFFCVCDIAEILIYNRAITTQERQQVELYLNTKYAIY
jgi:hypothetical protein